MQNMLDAMAEMSTLLQARKNTNLMRSWHIMLSKHVEWRIRLSESRRIRISNDVFVIDGQNWTAIYAHLGDRDAKNNMFTRGGARDV